MGKLPTSIGAINHEINGNVETESLDVGSGHGEQGSQRTAISCAVFFSPSGVSPLYETLSDLYGLVQVPYDTWGDLNLWKAWVS